MINRIYAVYDAKVSQFKVGLMDIEDGGAMRQFSDAVNDSQSYLSKHPEDYSLWYVGDFNTNNGNLIAATPVNLVNATALVSLRNNEVKTPQIV